MKPENDKPKRTDVSLELLLARKAELKQEISDQRMKVASSAESLLKPANVTGYIFRSLTKGLNVVDGILIGYRLVRTFKKFFRR